MPVNDVPGALQDAAMTDRVRQRRIPRGGRAPVLHIHTDTGSGPVVILVHGIASTSATFTKVVPRLAPGHRVITIDILGHGLSPKPAGCEYTLDDHVAALAATIRSLRLREPFVLVGHSLGSLIATGTRPSGAGMRRAARGSPDWCWWARRSTSRRRTSATRGCAPGCRRT